MKKKIFSVMLVAALAISTLAGCNNKSDKGTENQKQTEVTEATETAEEKTVSADGIKVTGSMGTAEKVEMSAVTDGDDYKAATDYLSTLTDKNITAKKVYDINLLDKNKSKVQPKDSVNIQLTLPDELVNAEGDNYEVYRKESNNTFTSLKSTIVDKEISFDTEHFSIYVVVKTSNAPIENTESTESTEVQVEPQTSEPEQSTYSYTDKSATMYAQSSVNVRDLPDTNGNKVGGLSTNQEVSVTGQCNETGWYRINYNGGTAYVSNSYLGDSKVETKKNTNSNNSSQSSSNTGTSSNTNNQQPAAPSDDTENTASEELPSNPYPLNTLVEDTGSSVSFYLLDIPGQGMTTPYEMGGKSAEYVMSIGKTPDVMVCDGVMGRYKEGVVAKWTRPYH